MHPATALPPQVPATRNIRGSEEHIYDQRVREIAHGTFTLLLSRPQEAWAQQPECFTEDWQASSVRSSSNHTAWRWDGSTAALVFPCYDQRSHAYEAPDHPSTAQPVPQTSQLIWSQGKAGCPGGNWLSINSWPFYHFVIQCFHLILFTYSWLAIMCISVWLPCNCFVFTTGSAHVCPVFGITA